MEQRKGRIRPKCVLNLCTMYGTPEDEEDDLHTADDGEPSQESHGASDETQLGLRLDLLVSLHLVEGGRVKVDLNQLKCRFRQLFPCKQEHKLLSLETGMKPK